MSSTDTTARRAPVMSTATIEAFAVTWRRWILAVIVVAGTAARLPGLNGGTLFKDDAWVALSSRVPMSTALHMLVTTPGFTLFERTWISLGPSATWWAQLPSLIASVTGILAVYLLMRTQRFAIWLSLLGAGAIAAGVTGIAFAAHVKPYPFDLLICTGLVALAQKAFERPSRRSLSWLIVASTIAPWWSLSLAVVVAGCWIAVLLGTRRHHGWFWWVVLGGAIPAVSIVLERVVLQHQITRALSNFWHDYFIDARTPTGLIRSLGAAGWRLFASLSIDRGGMPSISLGVAALAVWGIVLWLGARRVRVATTIVATALVASLLHIAPLGTQRTDLYLAPAILLLLAAAFESALNILERRVSISLAGWLGATACGLSVVLGIVLMVGIAPDRIRTQPGATPDTMKPDLLPAGRAALNEAKAPGSVLLVEESLWEWSYYFIDPVRIIPAPRSETSFGVVAPDSNVVIPAPVGGAASLHLGNAALSKVARASRVVTVRPDGEVSDPLQPTLARLCFTPHTSYHRGRDIISIYQPAGAALRGTAGVNSTEGPSSRSTRCARD